MSPVEAFATSWDQDLQFENCTCSEAFDCLVCSGSKNKMVVTF